MDREPGVRPRPSLWRRLDAAFRTAFPTLSTALLLLVLSAPLGLPGQAELLPAASVGCVYFWSLFRPRSMPPLMVFLLGLLADLLSLSPPGVCILVLLLVHGTAVRWRRALARQGFLLVWLAFVLVAAGASALTWLLICLLTFRLLPGGPVVFEFALASGLYPAAALLLIGAHRSLADPEQA